MTDILAIILGFLGLLSPTPTPAPIPKYQIDYEVNGKTYRVNWFTTDAKNVSLYSNLDKKQTSSEFFDEHKCKELTSAGFYTKENTPVGLFISDGKKIADYKENSLFNGIISDDDRWALQTGPWLFRDSQPLKLSIQNDEYARRIVAGHTTNNTLLYIAFYNPENIYEGPLLAQLPQHVQEFQKQTGVVIIDALNLDGGNASAFITSEIHLGELAPVGSFFCVH